MSKFKAEGQIAKAAILKAYRSGVRLRYSLEADREIALTEPYIEERIDKALAGGPRYELTEAQAYAGDLHLED